MKDPLIVVLLSTAVIAGTPLLFAALGEILSERAGVLNLGVEGMMLVGAVSGYIATVQSENHWVGVIAALGTGGMMAAIHAFLSVTLRANQVVSGLALTIFGTGLSAFLGKGYIGRPVPDVFKPVEIPVLSRIPYAGKILFEHDSLVYLSFLLVIMIWIIVFKTRWGLNLRAVGENPAAADSMGIPVYLTRYLYFRRNAGRAGRSIPVPGLCPDLGRKHDIRTRLDCSGTGYICGVASREGHCGGIHLWRSGFPGISYPGDGGQGALFKRCFPVFPADAAIYPDYYCSDNCYQ